MNQSYHAYLFNFSASYFGGALKRITAYLDWFNRHGGAHFVLNKRLQGIENKFTHNRYCFIQQNSLTRVLNYSPLFNQFVKKIGPIDFYYSYGVPLPCKLGKVNWLHIANVLPFVNARQYVSLRRSLELQLLGFLIKNSMKHADIISAESEASLRLIKYSKPVQCAVSVNGSDEEIAAHQTKAHLHDASAMKNSAVTVGTCQYKCIDDVYKIYLNLRESNPTLTLVIAGIKEDVPDYIKQDERVVLAGVLPQLEVCALLRQAKYYITATLIENSYNAASEGAYLAKESFVSDIGPHKELFKNIPYRTINNLGTRLPSLHVNRNDMNVVNLKSWDQVIQDMLLLESL